MLTGKKSSPLSDKFFGSASPTNPHSVKDHVQSLSEAEQRPVRVQLSNNLNTMLYIKQLEDFVTLYDCYQEVDKDAPSTTYRARKSVLPFFISTGLVLAFMSSKKCNVLHFESYLKNFYPIMGIYGASYLGFNLFAAVFSQKNNYQNEITRAVIHSQIFSLSNGLRFKTEEVSA